MSNPISNAYVPRDWSQVAKSKIINLGHVKHSGEIFKMKDGRLITINCGVVSVIKIEQQSDSENESLSVPKGINSSLRTTSFTNKIVQTSCGDLIQITSDFVKVFANSPDNPYQKSKMLLRINNLEDIIVLSDSKFATLERSLNPVTIWENYKSKLNLNAPTKLPFYYSTINRSNKVNSVGNLIQLTESNVAAIINNSIIIWDIELQNCITQKSNSSESRNLIQLDSNILAYTSKHKGASNTVIIIWNWKKDKRIAQFKSNEEKMCQLMKISSHFLCSAGNSNQKGKIRIWNWREKICQYSFLQQSEIYKIIQLKDGKLLSASKDGIVRVWDWKRKCCLNNLHHKGINRLSHILELDDGRILTQSGQYAYVWNAPEEHQECNDPTQPTLSKSLRPIVPPDAIKIEFEKPIEKPTRVRSSTNYTQASLPSPDTSDDEQESPLQVIPLKDFTLRRPLPVGPPPLSIDNLLQVNRVSNTFGLSPRNSSTSSQMSVEQISELQSELEQINYSGINFSELVALSNSLVEADISIQEVVASVKFVKNWSDKLNSLVHKEQKIKIKSQEQKKLLEHHNPHVSDYYEMVWMQLANTLLACKTMYSGHVENGFDLHFNKASRVLGMTKETLSTSVQALNIAKEATKSAVPVLCDIAEGIPYVGIFTKVVGKIVGLVGEQKKKRAVQRLAQVCREINQIDIVTEEAARALTMLRLNELEKLSPNPESQSNTQRLIDRWQHFVAEKVTTRGKALAVADADTIIKAIAEDDKTYDQTDLSTQLIRIVFPTQNQTPIQIPIEMTNTLQSSETTQNTRAPSPRDSRQIDRDRIAELENQKKRHSHELRTLRKEMSEHKEQKHATTVPSGNQALVFANASQNGNAAADHDRDIKRELAEQNIRMRELEAIIAVLNEELGISTSQFQDATERDRINLLGNQSNN